MRSLLVFVFCFELVASWGATAFAAGHNVPALSYNHFSEDFHPTDLILHILCEETNSSEERIEKTSHTSIIVFEVFSELEKFESVNVDKRVPDKLFDSSPPKHSLHQVFLI